MIQRAIFLLMAVATLSHAQTQVDLRNQSKNVDFSGAVATKPLKTGTTLPSTCQVGEMFFKSDAAPGANLYGCVAANQWILQASGGGGGGTGLPPPEGNAGRLLMSDGTYAVWALMGPGSGMSKTMVGTNTTWSVDSATIPFLGLNNAFLGINSFADRQQWTQISTPASPPAGSLAVYAKTGAGVCWKNSSGVETCAGAGGGGGAVSSVFARQGDVTAQSGDYNAGQITNTPAGNIAATNVQAAVNELDTEKAAVSHAHAAADITSGTLGLTRGGTNNGTWTAGRCVQVSTDGTKLENASGACGTAGGGMGDPGANGIVVRTAPNITTARTISGTTDRISVTNGDGVSGAPTIDAGANIIDKTQATTYTAGAKQTFQASATTAGLNAAAAALPSSPAMGDLAVDSADSNKLKWYNGTSWQAAGGGGGSSVVSYYTFAAATCQQGAASTGFALPSSNAPAPTCVTGSNAGDVTQANSAWNFGTLSFAKNTTAATAQSVQGSFVLPPYWDSSANIPVDVRWRTSATSGDVVWQIQGQCVADGEIPGSFSSPAAFAADTAKGAAWQFNDVTTKNLTTSDVLAGCAAGKTFLFRLFRDGTNTSDTLAAAGELISVRFQVTRTQ